jgi:two-component system, NarL family, nitrate/nitrite response regulator NarL
VVASVETLNAKPVMNREILPRTFVCRNRNTTNRSRVRYHLLRGGRLLRNVFARQLKPPANRAKLHDAAVVEGTAPHHDQAQRSVTVFVKDRIADESIVLDRPEIIRPYAVVVASDVRLYSEGLALVFAADRRLCVSVVAATAQRAMLCCAESGADAMLLDANMRGARDVLESLRHGTTRMPTVIFGVPELDEDLMDFIEAGAAMFVSRDVGSDDLILAVLSSIRGEGMLSVSSVVDVVNRLAKRARSGPIVGTIGSPLTSRETELASLLDEGLSNKEIAQRLQISVATVKNHVHRILEKLHVERRGQAVSRLRQPMDPRI